MKKTLLFVLVLSGLATLSTSYRLEYHHVKMLKTWAEARSYCREKFTDLATVANQQESDRMLSMLQDRGENAWIGLYDDINSWIWLMGNKHIKIGTDFDNWKTGEPDNEQSKERCVVMTANGYWRDFRCWELRPAVCYNETGPSKYILVKTEMNWGKAQNYCRSHYTDLVSVRNMSENNDIDALVTEKSWIGLRRNPWARWSDSTPTRLGRWNNWKAGQPNNHGDTMQSCVEINTTTGKWFDTNCNTKRYFICHKVPVRHKITVKLKLESEADLNDPDVQQQMLEQLHAKLEKKGLEDFKLRWIKADGQTFLKEPEKETEEGSCG